MGSIFSHRLRKTKLDSLDIYHINPDNPLDNLGTQTKGRPPAFIKINSNQHNLEVYLIILLLFSPFFVLFVRVCILDIPVFPIRENMMIPGLKTNMLLLGIGGGCLLPLLMIIGHDEGIIAAEVKEQWLLLLSDEMVYIEKYYSRIFVPFNQKYYVKNLGRDEVSGIEFIPHDEWRRAGGTCFNPDVAARFVSWRIAIQLRPEAAAQMAAYKNKTITLNMAEFNLGDITYDSVLTLHGMLSRWISADTQLKPMPPIPAKKP